MFHCLVNIIRRAKNRIKKSCFLLHTLTHIDIHMHAACHNLKYLRFKLSKKKKKNFEFSDIVVHKHGSKPEKKFNVLHTIVSAETMSFEAWVQL